MSGGTLWLVATPIGNLGDLAPRAIEVLGSADLVCCEDTRRTSTLLRHAGVRAARLAVANDHTEHERIPEVLDVLGSGGDVAVVTDAGTPGLSDPGERLVRAAVEAGFTVSAVPGPAAAIMALTISGLPTARFVFEGFLPRSGAGRTERLAELSTERRTIVLHEAPHRIARTLTDLAAAMGPARRVVLCRELTKLHEEVVRATLGTVEVGTPRGEYVVVVEGRPDDGAPDDETVRAALRAALADGLSRKDAVTHVAIALGVPRNHVYSLALAL